MITRSMFSFVTSIFRFPGGCCFAIVLTLVYYLLESLHLFQTFLILVVQDLESTLLQLFALVFELAKEGGLNNRTQLQLLEILQQCIVEMEHVSTPVLDTILVQLGLPLQRDRVIVARHPEDGYVCKVVRRIRSATIELASLDPSRPVIRIPRDERLIVGTVVLVWCTHRVTH